MNLIKKLSSLIFPHKCTFCREVIDYENYTFICNKCMNSLPFIEGTRCIKCGIMQHDTAMPVCHTCRKYNHSFSGAFTPLVYKDEVRHAILSMKFHERESHCHAFAFLIANSIMESDFPHIDFITYVPLSRESFLKRGFNQSELIANDCGKIFNLPVLDTIIRVDGTPRQSSLPLSLRRKNVKKAFKGKDMKLSGTALLIDDIYTTGSTMDYISSLLLKMGCDNVYIAAVASVHRS
ncbi:MAG: ComF family protein [Clostridia bacterium]|nr:ComF family protein [Clostridia bacterium]